MLLKKINILLLFVLLTGFIHAQKSDVPDKYDFGKMWTFENPPTQYLKEKYNFDVDQEWFDFVRKSSLRFATWCSASFISPEGLIMTNHHCSRDVVTPLQNEGENFDKNGFYAEKLEDERKSSQVFVEQLINVVDITDEVLKAMNMETTDEAKKTAREAKLKELSDYYGGLEDWKGLRIQTVTFYSGGKFSLYGYKRFSDVRLVWVPELDLGFYGGDPDNFTYPRYNLDATFWRAYAEDGKPLNTKSHYLKFNKHGAKEGDLVFVVGNPGRTERYRTVSQLEFDRDYRYPFTHRFLKNRNDLMMEEYNAIKDDPKKEMEAQSLLNNIASVANGMKAYGGIVKGLRDPELFGRKVSMENYIRSKSGNVDYWDKMAAFYKDLNPHGWAVAHLPPNPRKGNFYMFMSALAQYQDLVTNDGSDVAINQTGKRLIKMASEATTAKEIKWLNVFLSELEEDVYPGDNTLIRAFGGRNAADFVKAALKSPYLDTNQIKLHVENKQPLDTKDALANASVVLQKRLMEAQAIFAKSSAERTDLEAKIANQAFKVFGTSLPPDASFTLRISDGIMKGYEYNGTIAPTYTTYYGMYDRHYSHQRIFPWSLPERWLNPDPELLKTPYNCVSTNDIIGGNSGSPLINKNREAVGLIFDGNIESLPGNFIFDEQYNRTVSVHSAGIYAALKHIYKAKRILDELEK